MILTWDALVGNHRDLNLISKGRKDLINMSYQPVQNNPNADDIKVVELGEDSETEVDGCSRNSEDTLFLSWKTRGLGKNCIRDLYKKACKANIPVVISLHLLIFNVILFVALISQQWRGTQCGSKAKNDSQFAPGELLWSQYNLHACFIEDNLSESTYRD